MCVVYTFLQIQSHISVNYYLLTTPFTYRNVNLYVTDIMRRDIVCVSYGSSYKELRDMLNNYAYSSFALVDSAGK